METSKKIDNPLAFPRPAFKINERTVCIAQNGMTLLDYYAAHCPPVPEWFKPVMPPKPIVTTEYIQNHFVKNDDQKRWIREQWNDEDDKWSFNTEEEYKDAENEEEPFDRIPEHFKNEVLEYAALRTKEIDDTHEWDNDVKRQTLFQWPFYYANQLLLMRPNHL